MRRHDEAERALRRALELNPNFALAYAVLGLPLAIHGGHEEAVKIAGHAIRLSPNDPLIGYYASLATTSAHFTAGNYAGSVASSRHMIERYPDRQWGYYYLIAAAEMQKDTVTAREALATVLRLRPDFSLAWLREDMACAEEVGERLLRSLRRAGVPEN